MFRYALRPFHSAPLILLVVFTIGLTLSSRSLFGLPATILFVSWFFKYCFVMLDSLISGDEEMPVLSVEMLNPVSEQRPLAQAILIALAAAGVVSIAKYAGHTIATAFGAALLFALPASIAVIGITSNPLRAAWPPTLLALMRGLGWDYLWLVVSTGTLAALVYTAVLNGAPLWGAIALTMLFFMTTVSLIGGAVFEHRAELGVATRTRRERLNERDRQDHERERRAVLDESYAQLRLKRSLDAWQGIDRWLARYRGHDSERDEYHAVLRVVSRWDDPAVGDKLANEFIALLLAKRANGAALEVAERRVASNPNFRAMPAAQATRLAELAGLAGKRALKRHFEGAETQR
jgi:hypothetical protein